MTISLVEAKYSKINYYNPLHTYLIRYQNKNKNLQIANSKSHSSHGMDLK